MLKVSVLGALLTTASVQRAAQLGFYDLVGLDQAEVVVCSPGIPHDQRPVVSCPVISDIDLAYRLLLMSGKKPFFIGITSLKNHPCCYGFISCFIY